jgi:FtsP/CotA-like multicopper oxidase with cupredoxin domain
MNSNRIKLIGVPLALAISAILNPAQAAVNIQCPGDITYVDPVSGATLPGKDAIPDPFLADGTTPNPAYDPDVKCFHISGGDGYITMGDRTEQYILGFGELAGVPEGQAATHGLLRATYTAPTFELKEGQKVYTNLSNVGMLLRPDLFDSHSVHFHGQPNAATIFDGEPEAGASIAPGSTITLFWHPKDPGTYMWHCHVEASEHMAMGMLGNMFIHPAQDGNTALYASGKYVYNDTDGSTGFDVEYPIQLGSFDSNFHAKHIAIQPLPFADLKDDYAMINGRGYPDTVDPDGPPAPDVVTVQHPEVTTTQPLGSLITATAGERVLLRVSNLNVTRDYTLAAMGLTMKVVGKDARILRANTVTDPLMPRTGEAAADLYYETNSVTLGSGETYDILIDTTGVEPGTYYLYTTNLNYLSNGTEDFGGMMTEIQIL